MSVHQTATQTWAPLIKGKNQDSGRLLAAPLLLILRVKPLFAGTGVVLLYTGQSDPAMRLRLINSSGSASAPTPQHACLTPYSVALPACACKCARLFEGVDLSRACVSCSVIGFSNEHQIHVDHLRTDPLHPSPHCYVPQLPRSQNLTQPIRAPPHFATI